MHKERVKLRKLVKMQLWKRVFFHFENTKGYVNLPLRDDIFYFLTIFVMGNFSRLFLCSNYLPFLQGPPHLFVTFPTLIRLLGKVTKRYGGP